MGNEKVDNYHESFIKKLFERYSSASLIQQMATSNQTFFFKFAKHWPRKYYKYYMIFVFRFPEEQCDSELTDKHKQTQHLIGQAIIGDLEHSD